MPRSKPATPEEVALEYERTMREHGIAFHEERALSVQCLLLEHHLRLIMKPVFVGTLISDSPPREPFPTPALVKDVCRGLLKGRLGKQLTGRVSGEPWKPDNLVPAVMAFFLRTYGEIASQKDIHRLLFEHVLDGRWKGHLPEHERILFKDATPGSLTNQMSDNVKRAHKQLIRTMHSL
jgi:hypothetical protein